MPAQKGFLSEYVSFQKDKIWVVIPAHKGYIKLIRCFIHKGLNSGMKVVYKWVSLIKAFNYKGLNLFSEDQI